MATPNGDTRPLMGTILALVLLLIGSLIGGIADGWDPLRVVLASLALLVALAAVVELIRQRRRARRHES